MATPRNMIGPKLREIRSARGLTQSDLASRCQRKGWDLSRETLAKIEGQSRWVADFELVFFASVLDLSINDFFPAPDSAKLAGKMIVKLERRLE